MDKKTALNCLWAEVARYNQDSRVRDAWHVLNKEGDLLQGIVEDIEALRKKGAYNCESPEFGWNKAIDVVIATINQVQEES
jgi:hypothetical protein